MLPDYLTDEVLENEGVWCELPKSPGNRIKVARANNPEYEKLQTKLVKPYRKILNAGGDIPAEKMKEIGIELLGRTVIKDWDFTNRETGEKIPFSQDAAIAFLTKSSDFRNDVSEAANNFDNFHKKSQEEAAKN